MELSTYERAGSRYVYIKYTDEHGKIKAEATNILKTDPDRERKKRLAMNEMQARQLAVAPRAYDDDGGWKWVLSWIRARHNNLGTRTVYETHWDWIAQYLTDAEVNSPGFLSREQVYGYMGWRTSQVKEKSGKSPARNTAIGELKLLGAVMDEAVVRGLAPDNPARKLGLERDDPAEKPAMTDGEVMKIQKALVSRPVWMERSFHIALYTALRFGDTQIARTAIDWDQGVVFIGKPKGGKKKAFSIKIYPQIEPLLRHFWDSGEKFLWMLPPKERNITGLLWHRFLKEIGLPHLCFHCTRVTFITRGMLGGVPEAVMMKMVNHSSKEIHRIYQRLATEGAAQYQQRIALPPAVGAIR